MGHGATKEVAVTEEQQCVKVQYGPSRFVIWDTTPPLVSINGYWACPVIRSRVKKVEILFRTHSITDVRDRAIVVDGSLYVQTGQVATDPLTGLPKLPHKASFNIDRVNKKASVWQRLVYWLKKLFTWV